MQPRFLRQNNTLSRWMRSMSLSGVLLTGLTPYSYADSVSAAQVSQYNIPPQELGYVLATFATQSGIVLSFDTQLTKGLQSAGLHGRYSITQGFEKLLEGTHLQLLQRADGTLGLVQAAATPLSKPAVLIGELKPIELYAKANKSSPQHKAIAELPVIRLQADVAQPNKVNFAKTQQSIKDIPQSVTVINREQLDQQNLTDLASAMDKVNGINVWQDSVFTNSFISRGLEVSNIRVDGLSSALTLQDLSQFEQIEVLRGADGLFNGNGEPSATVNLVRKKPLKQNQTLLELSAGSWQNYRTSIDITGPIAQDGALRGRLVGSWNDQDFFYAVAEKNRYSIYGILEYDILPNTTASVGFSYDKLKGKQDWIGLPRYIDGRDIGFSRKTSFITNWSNIEAESTQYFAGIDHHFNDNWQLKFNISKEHMLKLNEYSRLAGSVDPVTNSTSLSYIKNGSEPDSWIGDLNLQGRFNLFNQEHSVVVGIDYLDKEDPFHYISGERSPVYEFNIFEFDRDAAIARPISRDYAPSRTVYTQQLGYYGTVKWQLAKPLKLITGARLNNYKFTQNNGLGQRTAHYVDKNVVIPFVGLSYDLTDQWLVYASVAETFKSQANLLDAEHKPLEPITGRNYEIGIKGDLWEGKGNFALSTYRTERDNQGNLLYKENIDDGNGSSCCYIGNNNVVMSGVELELSGEILPHLTGSIGYSYFNNHDDFKTISWRKITLPRNTLKAWLDYKMQDWTVGINVAAQSKQYATGSTPTHYDQETGKWGAPYVDYQFNSPGRAIWGAQLGYTVNPHLRVDFRVNNIFDKVYWQTIGDASGYNWYGEPRNYMLTLRAKY
ncbi:TonB-dependent siderophore receptor [Acinetobacter larvae]|uniref:Secretin/TonB short N-terminal domain-containing protein n=1 Tax=Acinetobacter larvae TaxID=1789224 RepID=A0A1B2M3H2_9GAMM|nr:TonB-dependent siderophore receptor [Acinetobacter larvae]AOA59750.1 hypothetical protein BFG52_16275 [Acinetobacter larvae]